MSTSPPTGRTILGMPILPDAMDSVWVEVAATKGTARYTYRAEPQQLIGLGEVDNTSDIDKPISNATQEALDGKLNTTDVINRLDSNETTQVLSAQQGKVLNDLLTTLLPILTDGSTSLTATDIHQLLIGLSANEPWLNNPTIDGIQGLTEVLTGLRGDINRLTLYTASELPIEAGGRALLPSNPLGSLSHNLAVVTLNDGSVVEMTNPTLVEEGEDIYVVLHPDDYVQYSDVATSITVSYLTRGI